MQNGGAKFLGVAGFCFGSYITMHAAASGEDFFKGGISIHPSHSGSIICHCLFNGHLTLNIPGNMANNNETEGAIYGMITSPQLIIPTPNDDENVQPGGLASQTLLNVGNFISNSFYELFFSGNNLACHL